jgi:hypothetical protein
MHRTRIKGPGREHVFRAWRLKGSPADPVFMRAIAPEALVLDAEEDSPEN